MKSLRFGTFIVALGLLTCNPESPRAAEFGHFTGNWSGSGTITVQGGSRERIRCRGANTESANTLRLALKCASDSYKFELQSDITSDGGSVSGSWNETTRGVSGSLSGRMTSGHIQATAESVGFSASLSISSRGNRQSVSIRSPGSEISEVAISLARSGR